jgi:hypothetical protein
MERFPLPARRRRRVAAVVSAAALVAALLVSAYDGSHALGQVFSGIRGSDGKVYTATNHPAGAATSHRAREYLLAWAGAVNPTAPDFIAVIDATKGSRDYGRVLNTVTLGPTLQNEPHHMQYVWHKGDRLYAGGIVSDTTYVFDLAQLPLLRMVGVNTPLDTPCGSAPDAYETIRSGPHAGDAYASYMGGPNVSGPCRYTNGQVRDGNGFAGSPGEIVLIDEQGRTVAEIPAATATGEDPARCHNTPALSKASCANPHGVQIREDLSRMIATDFIEVRNYLNAPPSQVQFDPYLERDTVRVFDITHRADPKLLSVTHLPLGPRTPIEQYPIFNEPRVVMENAVTHQRHHRGVFASTMQGGVIYYTPDITVANPVWREVFDDETAYRTFRPDGSLVSGGDGGSWLAVSPDDHYLFHTVIGAQPTAPPGVTKGMVYALDIRKLLASGAKPKCQITTLEESASGGKAPDCPALAGVLPVRDEANGGPHWAQLDNFRSTSDGHFTETTHASRLAMADYFVLGLSLDGNHQVCMVDIGSTGSLTVDAAFRDEVTGQPCVSFNRQVWPHGTYGNARPHGVLFVPDPHLVR